MILELTLNGSRKKLQARSGDRLVDVLRREAQAASLRPDCLSGRCGKCFAFMDGRLVHTCMIPAFKARGSAILTLEGLLESEGMQDILKAMDSLAVPPCAHCRTAKLMAAADLLERSPLPDRPTILEQMDMTACACDDPETLIKLVETAAELKQKRKFKRADQ